MLIHSDLENYCGFKAMHQTCALQFFLMNEKIQLMFIGTDISLNQGHMQNHFCTRVTKCIILHTHTDTNVKTKVLRN